MIAPLKTKSLTLTNRKDLVARLTSGIVHFKFHGFDYTLYQPNQDLLQRSKEVYDRVIRANRFSFWLNDDDIENLLIKQGLWDKCNDIKIEHLSKQLDDYKVDLYKRYCTNPDG